MVNVLHPKNDCLVGMVQLWLQDRGTFKFILNCLRCIAVK